MGTVLASAGTAGNSGVVTWTPAVIISISALMFTAASFWWLNVRRGALRSFQPFSFAAVFYPFPDTHFRIRFPLVFHNTGAAPIIVQNLQIRFLDEPCGKPLPWVAIRSHIGPTENDGHDFPAVFSVDGRTALQTFQEFGFSWDSSLGFTLEAKSYRLSLEARLSHKKEWRNILNFTLQAWRIESPRAFVTYDNSPGSITEDDRKRRQAALIFAQQGPKQDATDNDTNNMDEKTGR
jgi:hypothetical protein